MFIYSMKLKVNHSLSMSYNIISLRSPSGYKLIFNSLLKKIRKEKCLKSLQQSYSNSNSSLSPATVLSKSNREKCITLLSSQKNVDINIKKDVKKAAVLVPLCEIDNQLAVLYIVRALHLKSNGGEVAFPGGMLDTSDESLEAAALRETFEEIGINPKEVDIWGKGLDVNRIDVIVTPFLGYIGRLNPEKLKINTSEVLTTFPVSLEKLSSSDNFRTTKFRFRKTIIYKSPVYVGGVKRIWGLTARITHSILRCLISEHYEKNIKFEPSFEKIFPYKAKS